MKKIIALFSIAFLLIGNVSNAQALNKKSLLSGLNDSGIEGMSSQQKKEYEEINDGLVADLFKLDSKNHSKSHRDKEIDKMFDKRDNDVDKLFGKDDDYMKKFQKEYKKRSRSVRMKMKVAKLAL